LKEDTKLFLLENLKSSVEVLEDQVVELRKYIKEYKQRLEEAEVLLDKTREAFKDLK
jgi:uncharacterized protein (DUF2344 family)